MAINLQVILELIEKNGGVLDEVIADLGRVGTAATVAGQQIAFGGVEAEIAYEEFLGLINEVEQGLDDLADSSGNVFIDPKDVEKLNKTFEDLLPNLAAVEESFDRFQQLKDLGLDDSIGDLDKFNKKLEDLSKLDDVGVEKLRPQIENVRKSFQKLTSGEGSVEDFKKALKDVDDAFEAEKILAKTRKAEAGFKDLREQSGALGKAIDGAFGTETGDKIFKVLANLKNTFIDTNEEGNNFARLLASIGESEGIQSLDDLNGALSEFSGSLATGNVSAETFGSALSSLASSAIELGAGLTGASAVLVGAVAIFALLAVGVIAAGKALFDFASATGETFKELTKLSTISGVAIEKIQTYKVALEAAGLSADSLEDGLEALNDIISSGVISSTNAAIGLNRVAISLAEVERATPTERLDLFVNAIKNVQGEAEKIDIAKALGGESGARTLLALAKGADNATNAVDKLGLTLTKAQQSDLASFNKEVQFLQLAFDSLFQFIGAESAGIFDDLAKSASEAFLALRADERVVAGFKTLFDTVTSIVSFVASEAIPIIKLSIASIAEIGNFLSLLQNIIGGALAPILNQIVNGFEAFVGVLSAVVSPIETVKNITGEVAVIFNNLLEGNIVPLEIKIKGLITTLKDIVLTFSGINSILGIGTGALQAYDETLVITKTSTDAVTEANKKYEESTRRIKDTIATLTRTSEEALFTNQKLISSLTELSGERVLGVQRALEAGIIKESEAADRIRAINVETSDVIIKARQEELKNAKAFRDLETKDSELAFQGRIKREKLSEEDIARIRLEKSTEVTDGKKKVAAAEDALRQEELKREQQVAADRKAIQAGIFTEINRNLELETKNRQAQIDIQLAAIAKAEETFKITATTAANQRTEIRRAETQRQVDDFKSILSAADENTKALIEKSKEEAIQKRELTQGTLIAIDAAEKKGTLGREEAKRAREEIIEAEKRAEIAALKEITENAFLTEQQREEFRKRLKDLTIQLNKEEIDAEKAKREALIKDLELQFEMQKALADQAVAFAQRQLSDKEKLVKQSVDVETAIRRGGIADINKLAQDQFAVEKQLLEERNKIEIDAINKQIELQKQRIKLNEEENKSPTEQIAARTELIKLEQQRADIIASQIAAEGDAKQALFDFESAQRQIIFDDYITQLEQQGLTEQEIRKATTEFNIGQINREIEKLKETIKTRQAEGASTQDLLGLETELLNLIGDRAKAQKELNKLIEDQNKTFKESVDTTTDYLNKLLDANVLFKTGADAFAETTKNNLQILKEFAAENDKLINDARKKFEEEQEKLKELQEKAAEELAQAQEQAAKDREEAEAKANASLEELRKSHKEKMAAIEKKIGEVQTKALDDQKKIREKAQADRDRLEQQAAEKSKDRQEQFNNDEYDAEQKQIERLRNLRLQAELDELNRQQDLVVKKSDLNKSLNDALADLEKAKGGGDDKDIKAAQKKVDDIKKQLSTLENEDVASKDRASRKKGALDEAEAEFNKKILGAKSKDDIDAAEKEFNAKVDTINKKFKNEEDFFKQLEQLRKNNDTKAIKELTDLYNKEQALLDKNLQDQTAQLEAQKARKEAIRQAELKAEEQALKDALALVDQKEKDELAKIIAAAEMKIAELARRLAEEERLFKQSKNKIKDELTNALDAIEKMFGSATSAAQVFFNTIFTGAAAAGAAIGRINLGGVAAGGQTQSQSSSSSSSSSSNNGNSTVSSAGNVFGGGAAARSSDSAAGDSKGGLSKGGNDNSSFNIQAGGVTPDGDGGDALDIPSLEPKTVQQYEKLCIYYYKKLRGSKGSRIDFIAPTLFSVLQYLLTANGLEATLDKPNPQIGQIDIKVLEGLIKSGQVPAVVKSDKSAFDIATQGIIKVVDQALKLKGQPIAEASLGGSSKGNPGKEIKPIDVQIAPVGSVGLSSTSGGGATSGGQAEQPPAFSIPEIGESSGRAALPLKENLNGDPRHDLIEIYHYYIANFFGGDVIPVRNYALQYLDALVKSQKISSETASAIKQEFSGKVEGSLLGKEEKFITLLDALLKQDLIEKSKTGDATGKPSDPFTVEPTKQGSTPKTGGGDPSPGGQQPAGVSTSGGQSQSQGQVGTSGSNKDQALEELGTLLIELFESVTLEKAERPLNVILASALANKVISVTQGKAIRNAYFNSESSKQLAESLTKILGVKIISTEEELDGDQGASPTNNKDGDKSSNPGGNNKSLAVGGVGGKGLNKDRGDRAKDGDDGSQGKDGQSGDVNNNYYQNFTFSLNATAENKALVRAIALEVIAVNKENNKNQLRGQLGAGAISK